MGSPFRSLASGFVGACALAGCATTPAPISVVVSPPPAPAERTIAGDARTYLGAPRAPLFSQLFVCSPNNSNLGPIGASNESLAYTPYIATPAGSLLRDPTEGACLSSGFGWRVRGANGGANHTGIDLANANGGFVFAAADGTVAYEGEQGGYGFVVELDHGRGVHTFYGHLNDVNPALQPGAFVRGGTAIARMGATGNATGVHLHYEVIVDGLKVDPLNYGGPPVTQVTQTPMAPIEDAPAETADVDTGKK